MTLLYPEIPEKQHQALLKILASLEEKTHSFYSLALTQVGAKRDLILKPLESRRYRVTMEPEYASLSGYYSSLDLIYNRIDALRFSGLSSQHGPKIWQCPQCQQASDKLRSPNTIASAICRNCGYYHITKWDGVIVSVKLGQITQPVITYPYISDECQIIGSIRIIP